MGRGCVDMSRGIEEEGNRRMGKRIGENEVSREGCGWRAREVLDSVVVKNEGDRRDVDA